MKSVIIYGSHYGHTRSYAEKLSDLTGIAVFDHKHCPKDLSSMDLIIYMGGLYAGGLLGLSSVLRHLPKCCRPPFFIVTVGLADPKDPQNKASIMSSVSRQFGDFMPKKTEFFHLRGGIDYARLSKGHRFIMSMLYSSIRKKPHEKLSAEDRAVIQTYGEKVDFMDFESLAPISARILQFKCF